MKCPSSTAEAVLPDRLSIFGEMLRVTHAYFIRWEYLRGVNNSWYLTKNGGCGLKQIILIEIFFSETIKAIDMNFKVYVPQILRTIYFM